MNFPIEYNAADDPGFQDFVDNNPISVVMGRAMASLLHLSKSMGTLIRVVPKNPDGETAGLIVAYSGDVGFANDMNQSIDTVIKAYQEDNNDDQSQQAS